MKVFINKGILFKLIVCLCIFLVLFNFTGTSQVYAAEEAQQASTGGTLLTPVLDLLMTIGDGIVNIIQSAIMGTSATNTIDISVGVWQIVSGILAIVAGALVIVGITVASTFIPPLAGVAASLVGGLLTLGATVGAIAIGGVVYYASYSIGKAAFLPDYTVIPTIAVSPEEIFSGDLMVFDINFFSPKTIMVAAYQDGGDPENIDRTMPVEEWDETNDSGEFINRNGLQASYYYYENANGEQIRTSKQSAAAALSEVISKWYYTIRNVAIVVLMIILIYVGIRMLLTSIASEKSKYKKMLGDWIVAICLVFVLHYIMVFAVNINDNIVTIMKSIKSQDMYVHVIELDGSTKSNNLKKALTEAGFDEYIQTQSTGNGTVEMFIYPTNLMGQTRLNAQKLNGTTEYVGYAAAYIILVFYTIFFAFTYLKRVLMMAFLTVIAPLVAITYPIDKISDGHAQAFNTWLKEYIFNLLIQPVHLLLYVLLISMAFELAGQNIIYTLVAIGFMMPAEKFIRSMFGFDKAKTPGFLAGATGAALTMGAMQGLANLGKKIPHGNHNLLEKSNATQNDKEDTKGIYSRSADSGKGFESLLGDSDNVLPQNDNITNNNFSGGNSNTQDDQSSQGDSSTGLNNLFNAPNGQDGQMSQEMQDDLNETENGLTDEEQIEYDALNDELSNVSNEEMYLNPDAYADKQARLDELQQKKDKASMPPPQQNKPAMPSSQQPINTPKNREKTREDRLKELKKKHGKLSVAKDVFTSPTVWRNALGKSIETSGKILGGATGFTTGVLLGVASGDMNNVVKDAAVLGTSGTLLGGAVSGATADIVDGTTGRKLRGSFNERIDAGMNRRYGSDASTVKKLQKDIKFKQDKDARKFFATEFESDLKGLNGKEREEKLDEIMEDAIKYREYGVTDNEKIVKAMNLDKNNRTSNTSIASALMATKATDLKGIETYQGRLAKQVGASQAEKIAEGAMKINGIGFTGGSRARLNPTQPQQAQQSQQQQQAQQQAQRQRQQQAQQQAQRQQAQQQAQRQQAQQQAQQQQSQGSAHRQGPGRPRKINRTQPANQSQSQGQGQTPTIRTQPDPNQGPTPPNPGPDNN